MLAEVQAAAKAAITEHRMSPADAEEVARSFARKLSAYTYLTSPAPWMA